MNEIQIPACLCFSLCTINTTLICFILVSSYVQSCLSCPLAKLLVASLVVSIISRLLILLPIQSTTSIVLAYIRFIVYIAANAQLRTWMKSMHLTPNLRTTDSVYHQHRTPETADHGNSKVMTSSSRWLSSSSFLQTGKNRIMKLGDGFCPNSQKLFSIKEVSCREFEQRQPRMGAEVRTTSTRSVTAWR